MNRQTLTIKTPTRAARWIIETSHMVTVPEFIDADDLEELRGLVQDIADSKKVREDRPAIGEVSFRYELDKHDEVEVVHSYFVGKDEKLRRFMRLRRT